MLLAQFKTHTYKSRLKCDNEAFIYSNEARKERKTWLNRRVLQGKYVFLCVYLEWLRMPTSPTPAYTVRQYRKIPDRKRNRDKARVKILINDKTFLCLATFGSVIDFHIHYYRLCTMNIPRTMKRFMGALQRNRPGNYPKTTKHIKLIFNEQFYLFCSPFW